MHINKALLALAMGHAMAHQREQEMTDRKLYVPPSARAEGLIDVDHKPLNGTAEVVDMGEARIKAKEQEEHVKERTAKIIAGLKGLVEGLESGSLSPPEFIIMLPKVDGEVQLMYLGDPIPTVALEGIIHKVSTRLALQ